jgi:hypothetical protein
MDSRRHHPPPSRPISQLTTVPVVYGQVHFLPSGAFVHTTIALLSTRMPRANKGAGAMSRVESEIEGTTVWRAGVPSSKVFARHVTMVLSVDMICCKPARYEGSTMTACMHAISPRY